MFKNGKPACDMEHECTGTVTHIDRKGYVYCTPHGLQRQQAQACRALTPGEIKKINDGQPVTRY